MGQGFSGDVIQSPALPHISLQLWSHQEGGDANFYHIPRACGHEQLLSNNLQEGVRVSSFIPMISEIMGAD